MVKGLEKQKQLCHICEQLMVLLQIVSIFFIFITSLYWFLELIGNDMLSFMDSFIKVIKGMMQAQFGEELQKGQAGLDGSLFIFIALLGVSLYVISQVKIFLKCRKDSLEKAIVKKKEQEEAAFNKQLQEDAKRMIMDYKNIVVLINLSLKQVLKGFYQGGENEAAANNNLKKQEEIVLVALYNMLKATPGCNFSKDGKTLIITSKKFELVDTLLLAVDKALSTLNAQLKTRKMSISTFIAIDVFPDRIKLKDVYEDLKTLLQLNMPNEILCYGNFCNRYQYVKEPKFEAYLKGTYDITDEENVWSIVKKG